MDESCARCSTGGADEVRQVDQLEDQRVNPMVNRSCGCKLGQKGTACSAQFTPETITTQREHCLTLDKESLDMLVMGQFQAHTADTSSEDAACQKYVVFYFQGKRICRKFFMFIHTLSQKKYRNIFEHYASNGTISREHGNLHKAPHNRIPFDDVKDVISFIERYAEVHAMPLPGRLPNYKSDKSLLLPSNSSKSEIYRHYVTAKQADGKPHVSWAKFHILWRDTLPHIDTMKPASDLCFECQTNMRSIQESANMTEEEKFKRIDAAEAHLKAAKRQRDYYNEQCRQWYLYNEIRPFCSSPEATNLTCPLPSSQPPSTTTSDKQQTTLKRKRACSHCHQPGHTKTKRGKITCPNLLEN